MSDTLVVVNDPSITVVIADTSSTVVANDPQVTVVNVVQKGDPGGIVVIPTVRAVFNAISPVFITTLAIGTVISSATVNILSPFDGIGALVTVGTLSMSDQFVKNNDVDILAAAVNLVPINQKLLADTSIYLFLNPGTVATSGEVLITLEVI
jgi:hypothetical protein